MATLNKHEDIKRESIKKLFLLISLSHITSIHTNSNKFFPFSFLLKCFAFPLHIYKGIFFGKIAFLVKCC